MERRTQGRSGRRSGRSDEAEGRERRGGGGGRGRLGCELQLRTSLRPSPLHTSSPIVLLVLHLSLACHTLLSTDSLTSPSLVVLFLSPSPAYSPPQRPPPRISPPPPLLRPPPHQPFLPSRTCQTSTASSRETRRSTRTSMTPRTTGMTRTKMEREGRTQTWTSSSACTTRSDRTLACLSCGK